MYFFIFYSFYIFLNYFFIFSFSFFFFFFFCESRLHLANVSALGHHSYPILPYPYLQYHGSSYTVSVRQPANAAMHGPHSLVRFGPGCAGRA